MSASKPSGLLADLDSNASASVIAYCVASISMTAVNKYIFSGGSWNLTFFCLTVQVWAYATFPPSLPHIAHNFMFSLSSVLLQSG